MESKQGCSKRYDKGKIKAADVEIDLREKLQNKFTEENLQGIDIKYYLKNHAQSQTLCNLSIVPWGSILPNICRHM